jgi:pimeloyl-ACP methyl ester carboxylesterase
MATAPSLPALAKASVSLQGRRLDIAYREAGDPAGPPVVCLHGIGSNSKGFRFQFGGLPGCRVIAWDAPGYGGSARLPGESPPVEQYAAALAALLDSLSVGTCYLLGSSLGCLIGGIFAARYPERVRGAVFLSPAPGIAGAPADFREQHTRGRIEAITKLGPRGLAEERGRALLGPGASDEAVACAKEVLSELDIEGYAQACRMLSTSNLFQSLSRIRAETLVVAGTLDDITPPDKCAIPIEAGLPNARYLEISAGGHLLKLECPGEVNAIVNSFVRRKEAESRSPQSRPQAAKAEL